MWFIHVFITENSTNVRRCPLLERWKPASQPAQVKMPASFETIGKTPRPTDDPPFTLKDLKAAIPSHCFERSTLKSFSYVAWDVSLAWLMYLCTGYFDHPYLPTWAGYVLWPLYWILSRLRLHRYMGFSSWVWALCVFWQQDCQWHHWACVTHGSPRAVSFMAN